MKLRNKKTGETRELKVTVNGDLAITKDDEITGIYSSVAKLNEEWEDYEEPKEQYYIKENGAINTCGAIEDDIPDEMLSEMKSIGNYFETKEEAEKAVEKLKAFKRLKDKGVALDSFEGAEICENRYCITFSVRCDRYWLDRLHSMEKDLHLLFGGEE